MTIICLHLKRQVESVIPCELAEESITRAHSPIITPGVVETAKGAGGEKYKACVVFCLLVVKRWFRRQALRELWNQELHTVRAVACEVIAKHILEGEENLEYLHQEVLLKRYSILINGEETAPANVIERAVDLHALRVIGSSGEFISLPRMVDKVIDVGEKPTRSVIPTFGKGGSFKTKMTHHVSSSIREN